MKTISFEQLPRAVADLIGQVSEIKTLLEIANNPPKDRWMDLNELCKYDPERRSKVTFYSYIQDKSSDFPYHKRGKKILVLKSEFDNWLRAGKIKTKSDLHSELDEKLSLRDYSIKNSVNHKY